MLTQAAETLGCSVSDFVLNTLQDAAQHVMKNTEQTTVIQSVVGLTTACASAEM